MKYKIKDAVAGLKINGLTLIKQTRPRVKGSDPFWLCRCDCGREKEINVRSVLGQRIKSCGCSMNKKNRILSRDIKGGMTFGKLTLIKNTNPNEQRFSKIIWECQCECGNKITSSAKSLRAGRRKSCGCLRSENSGRRKHGQGTKGKETPEYKTWMNILSRCGDAPCVKRVNTYKNYSARGIFVCERWKNSFAAFYEDMGIRPSKDHSIDRINNNDGYYKENCRWATDKEQCNNRRFNLLITIDGVEKTLQEWSDSYKIKSSLVSKRLKRDWPIKMALETPPTQRGPRFWLSFDREVIKIENEKAMRIRIHQDPSPKTDSQCHPLDEGQE